MDGAAKGDLSIGLGVIALAFILGWQASVIPANATYAQVGPAVFPWLIAALLLAFGAGHTAVALHGGWSHGIEDKPEHTDFASLGWVAAGLAVNAGTIEFIGFILASTAMFVLVARGFGSTKPLRDAAIAFALALASYVGFDRVLGYKIGSGLVESLI